MTGMSSKRKLSNEDKKAVGLDLYLNTDKSQNEICNIISVTPKTFSKWKNDGDWELLKQAQTITSKNIIFNLYKKAHDESLKDDMSADKMIKIATSIEKLSDRRVTIAQIINVFQEFTTYAFNKDADLAKQINVMQKEFVEYKIEQGQ
jgi:hypothetical protein